MKISEVETVREDDIVKQHLRDTRMPKLTLQHLNKLRKMRELRYLERMYQDEQLQSIFGSSSEDSSAF